MRWIAAGIQLHNGDDQTADWIATAGTPETRARVRRWSRVETTGVYAAIARITLLLITSIVTLVVAVWFSATRSTRTIWTTCSSTDGATAGKSETLKTIRRGPLKTAPGSPFLGGGPTWRCAS